MNYYYDVLLNFHEDYYMFYEWDEFDNIDFVKKIPLFHIDSKELNQMISKIFKVELNFLNQIDNKTKLKNNKYLKYACIVSDGKNSLGLEFNKDGMIINKSSLIIDDELNINEFIYSINKAKINYIIIKNQNIFKEVRQITKIKNILSKEVESMYKNKNHSKLKYIYLEWFELILEDIDLMYKNMLEKIDGEFGDKEYYIYELIKKSYNNV